MSARSGVRSFRVLQVCGAAALAVVIGSVPAAGNATYDREWGSTGTNPDQFDESNFITKGLGAFVYTTDFDQERVQRWTTSGLFDTSWSVGGAALGIAVDHVGDVFVVDRENDVVRKYTTTGGVVTSWGAIGTDPGEFQNPVGIAADAAGNVYVTDANRHRVLKFDNDGNFLLEWGDEGSGPGEFSGTSPWGIAVSPEGDVYVTDRGSNDRVQRFTATGTFVAAFGGVGNGAGTFTNPMGIGFDASGRLFVTDFGTDRIEVFDSEGGFLGQWGTRGSGPGEFVDPTDVTTDKAGEVFVMDHGNDRVQVFDYPLPPTGCYERQLLSNISFETGDFTSWTATTNGGVGACDTDWAVKTGPQNFCAPVAKPVDGTFAAYNSFDGAGPKSFVLTHDFAVPAGVTSAELTWYDTVEGQNAGSEPRTFTVEILDSGGAVVGSVYQFVLEPDSTVDIPWTLHTVDVSSELSGHEGEVFTLRFTNFIPEDFTGEAAFGLDEVSIVATVCGQLSVISVTCPPDQLGMECDDPDGTSVSLDVTVDAGASDQVELTYLVDGDVEGIATVVGPFPRTETFAFDYSLGSHTVTVDALEISHGSTSSCSAVVEIVDTLPPTLDCPDVTVEGAGMGTVVTYPTTAFDVCDPASSLLFSLPSGSELPLGATTVTCTATDASGNSSSCQFTVDVVDTTPPVLTCPDVAVECAGMGTVVTYPTTVFDVCDPSPSLLFSPPSGSEFPLGATTVTCTATDASGNSASCQFTVDVVDTTAPTLTCPDVTVECAGMGTVVTTYPTTVFDVCDPAPALLFSPPSGSEFPLGTTTVTCTATDASGNSSSCQFTVDVVDTTPPTLSCPDVTAECTGMGTVVATYPTTAFDVCDPAPALLFSPPSGSELPLGTTTVTCTATDVSGNSSSCQFTVDVVDTTAPTLTCPDVTAECTGMGTVVATYPTTALDVCDPAPSLLFTPPSGSEFPLGATTVTCTATDASGNSSSCQFTVDVVDTTAPALTCPDVTAECTGMGTVVATYPTTAFDVCDPAPSLVFSPPAGTAFPLGATAVTCTATDASGNSSSCQFTVDVVDTTPPTLTCPNVTVECAGAGMVVAYPTTAFDVCDPAPSLLFSPPAGTAFPMGATTVTCTATDASGNSSSCQFTVDVVDTTPPTLNCPNVTVESAGTGTVVTYPTTAFDACDAAPSLLFSPPAGTPFPMGATTVTCTATDDAGNSSSCQFTVQVVDTTPPVVTASAGRTTLWLPQNGMLDVGQVRTVSDLSDPAPTVTTRVYSDEPNGALPYSPDASLGGTVLKLRAERNIAADGRVYLVVVRAVDASGNAAVACYAVVVPVNQTVLRIQQVQTQAAAAVAASQSSGGAAPPGYVALVP